MMKKVHYISEAQKLLNNPVHYKKNKNISDPTNTDPTRRDLLVHSEIKQCTLPSGLTSTNVNPRGAALSVSSQKTARNFIAIPHKPDTLIDNTSLVLQIT